MMLDLSPQKTLVDCSGEGHILAKHLEPSQKKEEHTADTRASSEVSSRNG